MTSYPEKLLEVVRVLGDECEIVSFQIAGMGWAAKLIFTEFIFTLHSDRGWVDVYAGDYSSGSVVGCSTCSNEIAKLVTSSMDNPT